MITFKNIAGNKFLAVGTIQRKSALNGEKSLTGTLYDGNDVLNKIDKGWSLEFDGEPYVVTYFERNDNDNSVSFDAIHKFFWDMTKKVLYSSTEISGSHTIKWYLDQIFANTGYTYALNFSPAAIEKDNWGNKTRLSLFNDLITSIAGEFEINGTLISIFQNIGTDLSTIVRYGFNLSDMTIENDATSFVTYGEGFGAYADQQNQTGDRVHVTYTSPLASVYGILQAEPIDDQRYTSQANLQAAVKAQVDASFSVSVQLSLYDLTAAGYPYKMANVGDWLTAVDENLDFKQRIRIISIDDEFSADGTRISYTVTAGDVGLTKKYQDANASMASQVANAVASASQASTDANNALISANGKNTSYYLNSVDDLPTTANEGDLAWVKSGDGTVMYIYTKKSDGSYYWEKRIDPEMGDQIAAGVTEAVAQANAHTDEVKQGLSTDITTAKAQAKSQADTAQQNAITQAQTDAQKLVNDSGNTLNGKITTVQNNVDDLTGAVGTKVSQTTYNQDQQTINGKMSDLTQDYTQLTGTVSDINAKFNNLGQVNQLFNTEFSPDFAGWYTGLPSLSGTFKQGSDFTTVTGYTKAGGKYSGSSVIRRDHSVGTNSFFSDLISVNSSTSVSAGIVAYSTSDYNGSVTVAIYFRYYDENKNYVSSDFVNSSKITVWQKVTLNKTTPGKVAYVSINFVTNGNAGVSYYSQPMLVFAPTVGTYVQGNYNNNAALAQVKITADGINNFVRDASGNISSDFQTALSKTSIITGSTLATSIQKQTATQITSALTDNNGKIISLINQDTSGVQIAGKNIVLNGDTTVTGAFKVSQANIANGAIGTAQIGDAAITSAKIADLDVSKITGDVSNFIQSNWNGKYSSTTISSTGMQIGGFTANGFDTIFDKTGITFETTDARYGYAIAHYGTDTITNSSGQVLARGMEIRTGNQNGIGFDYFAIKSPGANNLEFGKTTNAGHVSIAVVPDTNLMPILNQGVTILDDLYFGKVNGANAGGLFSVLAGRTIHIATSMNSNGTVGGWLTIQL